jgi:Zn-dependent protease with chaperone function
MAMLVLMIPTLAIGIPLLAESQKSRILKKFRGEDAVGSVVGKIVAEQMHLAGIPNYRVWLSSMLSDYASILYRKKTYHVFLSEEFSELTNNNKEMAESVISHEIGHVKNRDHFPTITLLLLTFSVLFVLHTLAKLIEAVFIASPPEQSLPVVLVSEVFGVFILVVSILVILIQSADYVVSNGKVGRRSIFQILSILLLMAILVLILAYDSEVSASFAGNFYIIFDLLVLVVLFLVYFNVRKRRENLADLYCITLMKTMDPLLKVLNDQSFSAYKGKRAGLVASHPSTGQRIAFLTTRYTQTKDIFSLCFVTGLLAYNLVTVAAKLVSETSLPIIYSDIIAQFLPGVFALLLLAPLVYHFAANQGGYRLTDFVRVFLNSILLVILFELGLFFGDVLFSYTPLLATSIVMPEGYGEFFATPISFSGAAANIFPPLADAIAQVPVLSVFLLFGLLLFRALHHVSKSGTLLPTIIAELVSSVALIILALCTLFEILGYSSGETPHYATMFYVYFLPLFGLPILSLFFLERRRTRTRPSVVVTPHANAWIPILAVYSILFIVMSLTNYRDFDTEAYDHHYLGRFYGAKGDSTRALAEYKIAVARKANMHESLASMGELYYYQQNYGQASKMLVTALTYDPGNGFAHFVLGETLSAQAKNNDAIAEFNLALRYKAPIYAPVVYGDLGLSYYLYYKDLRSSDKKSLLTAIRELQTANRLIAVVDPATNKTQSSISEVRFFVYTILAICHQANEQIEDTVTDLKTLSSIDKKKTQDLLLDSDFVSITHDKRLSLTISEIRGFK